MFTWLLALLADDPISSTLGGGAGWVGAGLLGGVLAWLLFIHLPGKDKQLKDFIDSKDKQVTDLHQRNWEMLQQLTKDYKEGMKDVALHCEQEISKLTTYWQSQLSGLTKAIQDLTETIDQMRFPPRDSGKGTI